MNKIKRLFSCIIASAAIMSAVTVSASAELGDYIGDDEVLTDDYYDVGDRYVEYFSFSFNNNAVEGSSATAERRHNRNFVVSVNSFSGPSYSVKYCMGNPYSDTTFSPQISYYGTGNTGGSYYSSTSVGYTMNLVGQVDTRDFGKTIAISGQFSPDAPS